MRSTAAGGGFNGRQPRQLDPHVPLCAHRIGAHAISGSLNTSHAPPRASIGPEEALAALCKHAQPPRWRQHQQRATPASWMPHAPAFAHRIGVRPVLGCPYIPYAAQEARCRTAGPPPIGCNQASGPAGGDAMTGTRRPPVCSMRVPALSVGVRPIPGCPHALHAACQATCRPAATPAQPGQHARQRHPRWAC